jgi:hypothetical protein
MNRITLPYILFSTISPVIGLYFSIKDLTWRQLKWPLIIFVTWFGATINLPESADSFRHQQMVENYYVDFTFSDFLDRSVRILNLSPAEDTNDDMYIHIISYISGGIIGVPRLFFAIVAFVFSYFYITALSKILVWDAEVKKTLLFYGIIVMFIIYRGIDNMQTVRTWTGAWILFNGVFGYHQTKKIKYLFLILLAPMVHSAFLLMALPAFIVIFVRWLPPYFFIVFYIISFFISVSPTGILDQISESDLGKSKVDAYYRENPDDYAIKDYSKVNWYAEYGKTKSLHWGTQILIVSIFLAGLFSKRKMTDLQFGLFATGVLTAVFANLVSFIPALHSRSLIVAGLFVLATVVLMLTRANLFVPPITAKTRFLKFNLWVSLVVFFPYFVYSLSNFLQFGSIFLFVFPFLIFFSFEDLNISIREFIEVFLN